MFKTWKIMDLYTPPLIRCLAKKTLNGKHVEAISDQEIAIASGLTIDRIRYIYNSRTWNDISVKEMRLFCAGCNFDPLNKADANRARAYMGQKKPKWTYLKKSPWWDLIFRPLILGHKTGNVS